jgi:hypothetical protein
VSGLKQGLQRLAVARAALALKQRTSSSQRSESMIWATFSGLERSRSVSSMRSTSSPCSWRASSQLNSAVRAPPMCSAPVGEGAKRTLTVCPLS